MDQADPQHGKNGSQSAIQACHLTGLVKGGAELDVDYPMGSEAGRAELEEIHLVQVGAGRVISFGQIEDDQVEALPLSSSRGEGVSGITKTQADLPGIEGSLGQGGKMAADHGDNARIKFSDEHPLNAGVFKQFPRRSAIATSEHHHLARAGMAQGRDVHQAFVDHELIRLGRHRIPIQKIKGTED